MDQVFDSARLQPPPYLRAVVDYLKAEDPAVWKWFAEKRDDPEQAAAIRLELLKATYRLERQTAGELYALADEAAAKLGLDLPITIYQAQHPQGLNASIAHLPGEIHLVLSGPVATTLSTVEVKGLFGHELAHRLLWDKWNGDFRVAAQLLEALATEPGGPTVYAATDRLYGLYTELFCDRAAWLVCQDLNAAVSMLVKISTELKEVSAESYLRQADEIFSQQEATTEGITHPESYIRARSLRLWLEQGEEAAEAIAAMLEGPLTLAELDLLGQRRVAQSTRRLFDELLVPAWFQTERVLAHARSFFDDYQWPAASNGAESNGAESRANHPTDRIATRDTALQDYFCYLLLDFATVDRDLEELPLAAALLLAGRLELADRFKEVVLKELKLTKKRFTALEKQAAEIVAGAERSVPTL